MKRLSKVIGKEIILNPRYAIARFMSSKKAYKTKDFQPMWFTIKPIVEKAVGEQIQVHIRFEGIDEWHNDEKETLDIDVYIPIEEWEQKMNPDQGRK